MISKPKLTEVSPVPTQKKKIKIPRALREQVWVVHVGKLFETKCLVDWCQNKITVFDFHVGHNIPESQGGSTDIKNLKPICARCNLSMGSQYSIEEWSKISKVSPLYQGKEPVPVTEPKKPKWLLCC
jgi:5-methylcytosine-specific restriction endonuclease McrA